MELTDFMKDCVLAIVIVCIFCGLFTLTLAFDSVSSTQTTAVTEQPHNGAAALSARSTVTDTKVATTKVLKTISAKPEVVPDEKKDADKERIAPENELPAKLPMSATTEKSTPQVAALPVATTDEDTYRAKLISLIQTQTNEFRNKHDLPSLGYSTTLESTAKKYSSTLLARGILSHTDKNNCDMSCRFAKDNYKANALGENLAMIKSSELLSVTEVATYFMREWEKSSGHRANLLSPSFTTQGVGVSIDDGSVYVAVHFSSSL
ncbi:MAG: hypothetical protein RLZZ76_391 [Candidatus Parcubacteria bacterium]|jgi:uncharacterized protein YkwD